MKRFIEGVDRSQTTLFPDRPEEGIDDDNPVRVIDVFVDDLELLELGSGGLRQGGRGERPIIRRFC